MEGSKKVSKIYARSKNTKNPSFTQVESQVGTALQEIISGLEGDNKRFASFIEVNKAVEVPMGKEKPAILVFFSFKSQKVLLTNLYKKLVSDLEKKLKTTVMLVAYRNIQSRWIKKNRTQKRPYSRTLTNVYESLLTELLLPSNVISDRTRVRLDGSSVRKVVLDKNEEHFMQGRVEAIKKAYKTFTHSEIEVSFDKEPHYYTLKQGQRQK